MCWSRFIVKLSTSSDWNNVIKAERIVMQRWQVHVDRMTTQPADREFRVTLQALTLLLDVLLPAPINGTLHHTYPLPKGF